MNEQTLSDCELLVMRVIWNSGEELSLQDIVERVNRDYHREWKAKTVSVFLGRIVQKGLLTRERRGRLFFYFPTVKEDEYKNREINKFVDFWGDGRLDVFLAALGQARNLTQEDKDELRKFVDDLD